MTTQTTQFQIKDVINTFLFRARTTTDFGDTESAKDRKKIDAYILGAMQLLGYEREGWQFVTLEQIQAISPLAYKYEYANW